MRHAPFTFDDLVRECAVETGCHRLDGRTLGARVRVPTALRDRYPYNASAYAFLQQLRQAIDEHGLIEFPDLPLNPTNHTLAQRSPEQHRYSRNPYLTDYCQSPHQDTPPYPTAFWLDAPRRFFATWVLSTQGVARFAQFRQTHPGLSIDEVHRTLVPASLTDGTGLLLNREPGLLLIDNSEHQRLYHARTCLFNKLPGATVAEETPMYAFNEVGLLHYIDTLDERRGLHDRDADDRAAVRAFLEAEARA